MSKVMLTIEGLAEEPTLARVMEEYQLTPDEVDQEYGVQLIDPAAGAYVIMVEESAASRVSRAYEEVAGPYSNPKIETLGLPED